MTTWVRRVLAALHTPRWISRLVLTVGAVSVASALLPAFHGRLHLVQEMIPDIFPAAATTGAAAIGTILIVLSGGLRRGKFRAWLLATILAAIASVLHLVKGLDVEEALMCVGLTALLLRSRREFSARPDPRSLARVVTVLTLGPLIAGALGFLWLVLDDAGEAAGTGTLARLAQAYLGLIGVPGPVAFVSTGEYEQSAIALLVLGAAVLLVATLAALRPAGGPHRLDADEQGRVRALLARWGWLDSLGYFALRDDRSVVFPSCGRAAISYRVIGGVSLAGGDPIGDPTAWGEAIEAWLDEAKAYGWTPAALGSSERGATAFHRAGLECLEIGDEAIIRADGFTLSGRSMRGVRQAVARCERAGVSITVERMRDLDAGRVEELRALADAWRDGAVERGFSMALGRFGDPTDADSVLVTASGPQGVIGLLHLVPWGPDGLSLDLMRRSRGTENGVVETMVAGLMAAAPDLGVDRVSLNFAVFRSVFARGERLGAGPVQRLWRGVLLWASRFWQIESLYRANAKYQPEWVPRFIVFRTPADLPRVTTAALRAEAFLCMPTLGRRSAGSSPADGDQADSASDLIRESV
ncbi:phosphatidylglycerol lysyltransferase domain-containing protein [Nocardioides nematodiphilus]|uniref:phosphatidylglycerol lysyltransferase domain-containing protein n=1 Tax=Nocardioides nematodiphilus TaxID=2849669 RepID=UPI001CD92FB6|nr:phosphatidylglycerol lysyltransferase domain-containing protein [Nocardioides nematodiphilus]MCA1984363.1 phosphatidylglycerol lysyltransferase domain-containing protein [Nocardioides nematodiphilus]